MASKLSEKSLTEHTIQNPVFPVNQSSGFSKKNKIILTNINEVKKDTNRIIKNKNIQRKINNTSEALFKTNLILFLFMFLLYLIAYYTGGGLWGCFFWIFFLFYKFYYYLFLIIIPVNIVLIILSERKWYIKLLLIFMHILFFAGVMQFYVFLFPFG
jgi:hypothetical protein